MCSAPNFTVLYFLTQSFPEQAIHVSGLCFVSATGLCNTFLFVSFFLSLTFVCIVATGMRVQIWFVYHVIKY